MKKTRARVALVEKRSSYRKFVLEDQDALVAKLLKKRDPSVGRMKQAHEDHESTLREVEAALKSLDAEIVHRAGPHAKITAKADLIVTVGGDGTLLDASHLIGKDVPLLGINSAPGHSVGFFCGGVKGRVRPTLKAALAGSLADSTLTRMRVELNGECIHARVLNEALFCHASPAATSRYILQIDDRIQEDQRSSGLWVGPAAGSTAAMRSAGGEVLPLGSAKIQYVVREPYTPAGEKFRYKHGLVKAKEELVIRCKIRDGKVFMDGHRVFHAVTLGDVLVMRRSEESLTVLGISKKRRGP